LDKKLMSGVEQQSAEKKPMQHFLVNSVSVLVLAEYSVELLLVWNP
jgi:hypothetical protein